MQFPMVKCHGTLKSTAIGRQPIVLEVDCASVVFFSIMYSHDCMFSFCRVLEPVRCLFIPDERYSSRCS